MKHFIIVKYKEEIDAEEKEKLVPEIAGVFSPVTEIPGIHAVKLHRNCVSRSNRYDLAIEIDMDREALEAYDASDAHKQWKEQYSGILEKKAIFDCED